VCFSSTNDRCQAQACFVCVPLYRDRRPDRKPSAPTESRVCTDPSCRTDPYSLSSVSIALAYSRMCFRRSSRHPIGRSRIPMGPSFGYMHIFADCGFTSCLGMKLARSCPDKRSILFEYLYPGERRPPDDSADDSASELEESPLPPPVSVPRIRWRYRPETHLT